MVAFEKLGQPHHVGVENAQKLMDAIVRDDSAAVMRLAPISDLSHRDPNGYTPLMRAVFHYGADFSAVVAKHGPEHLNARCEDGMTALMFASQFGRHERVETLLRAGADVHLTDDYGRDALICAATRGQTKCFEALLPKARIDTLDHRGMSAFDHARNAGAGYLADLARAYHDKNELEATPLAKPVANAKSRSL